MAFIADLDALEDFTFIGDAAPSSVLHSCLDGFSCGLQSHVTAFSTSLLKTSSLPQSFKERVELAMRDVHISIDNFRSDMLIAVRSETSCDDSKVRNGRAVLNGLPHELASIWKCKPSAPQQNDLISHAQVKRNPVCTSHISFTPDTRIVSVDESWDDPKQLGSYSATTSYEVGQAAMESDDDEKRSSARRESQTSGLYDSVSSIKSQEESYEERNISNYTRSRPAGTTATTEQNYLQAASVDLDKEDEEDDPSGCFVKGVLNPNFPARLAWDLNTMFLVMCDAMILPFQMSYKDGDNPDAFDTSWLILTTSFFAIDICMNFYTGYQAGTRDTDFEPGRMITMKRRIAKNYLRTWFCIDFFSTVPWGAVVSWILGGGSGSAGQLGKLTKVIKFVRFMRLMRMLRLAKLAAIWEKVEARCGSVVLIQGVALLRVLFVLVCICHWNACIWWMIGQEKSILTELLSDEDQATWANEPHWTTIYRSNGPGEPSWRWMDRPLVEAYIFCFYWTLGVMRTMPAEVTPVSQPERIYVMIFMFFAFSAFAICVAMITQTFFKFSERKRVFNDDMAAVRMHLRKYKASEQLQMKIKTYLRHLFDTRYTGREQNMLATIPEHLRNDLQHIRFASYLEKMKIFVNVSYRSLQLVTTGTVNSQPVLESRNYAPGDVLSMKLNTAKAAFVLVVGRLRIQDDEEADATHTMRVKISVVDEKTLATDADYNSSFTVICQCACTCLRIDKERFRKVVAGNTMFWNSSFSAKPSTSSSRTYLSQQSRYMNHQPTIDGAPSIADAFTETRSQASTKVDAQNVAQAAETAAFTLS